MEGKHELGEDKQEVSLEGGGTKNQTVAENSHAETQIGSEGERGWAVWVLQVAELVYAKASAKENFYVSASLKQSLFLYVVKSE